MQLTPSNWRDIDRYYDNTYVKFPEFGDKLFYIQTVTETRVTGINSDKDPFDLDLAEEAPYVLEYTPPHKAVFQHKASAVFLQRKPAKQYKRGLCSENTELVDCVTGEKLELAWDRLEAYVTKQQYVSLQRALELTVYQGSVKYRSVALNSRMCLNKKNNTLMLDSSSIGTLIQKPNKGGWVFQIQKKFEQEAHTLVKADPFNVEIITV